MVTSSDDCNNKVLSKDREFAECVENINVLNLRLRNADDRCQRLRTDLRSAKQVCDVTSPVPPPPPLLLTNLLRDSPLLEYHHHSQQQQLQQQQQHRWSPELSITTQFLVSAWCCTYFFLDFKSFIGRCHLHF